MRRASGGNFTRRYALGELELAVVELIDRVDITRRKRRQLVFGLVVKIVDLVEIDLAAPPLEVLAVGRFGDPLQHALFANLQLGHHIGAGADHVVGERRHERGVQHGRRVMIAIFRNRQVRACKVQLEGVLVDNFKGTLAEHLVHLDVALVVLLAAVHVVDHLAKSRQADNRRGDLRVAPAFDVPFDDVGRQFVAVVEHDPLAELERPSLEIVGG